MKSTIYGNTQYTENNKNNLNLLIELDLHRVRYSYYNSEKKHFFYLNNTEIEDTSQAEQEISNILSTDEIIKAKFNRILCSVCSNKAMLVPQTLFDENNLQTFLKFHHRFDEKDEITFYNLKEAEAFVIYSIPLAISRIIKEKLPEAKLLHHSIPFLKNSTNRENTTNFPAISLFIGPDFFDVVIVKQGKIQLFNSFLYRQTTDIIYFLSNLVNLFSLTPQHTSIFISTNCNSIDRIINELKKVFSNIQFENFPKAFNFADEILALPQHEFVTLFNLQLCE